MYMSPRCPRGTLEGPDMRNYLHDKRGPKEREVLRMSLVLTERNSMSLLLRVFGYPLPVTHLPSSLSSPIPPPLSFFSLLSHFPLELMRRLIQVKSNWGGGDCESVSAAKRLLTPQLFVGAHTTQSFLCPSPVPLATQTFQITQQGSSLLAFVRDSASHRGQGK